MTPADGSRLPAALWLLANARPKERSMPITSPVERISGPSTVSTSGKRLNGSTASFTEMCPPTAGGRSSSSSRSSASVAPSITRAAALASGTPVALLTNGTVRDARGLASITKISPSFTANCTLSRPRTSSASASARVARSICATIVGCSVGGGIAHAGVAGVHAGLLDVFHHAADDRLAGGVADGVDVDLHRVLEEAVDEHRALGRESALAARGCPRRRAPPWRSTRALVVRRRSAWHGPEHVDGRTSTGKPELDAMACACRWWCGAARGLRDAEAVATAVEALAVSARSIESGLVPSTCTPRSSSFWPA
jgi:hypothetical protein